MTVPTCTRCGTPLADNAPGGLCPKCLLNAALNTEVSSAESAAGVNLEPAMAVEAIAADFPNLEVIEILGQGGMGIVYKARQLSLDRIVALKVLSPRVQNDPAFEERFTREARALARLSHPNIVSLYEYGQQNGRYYFIMEYVDGINLREALHEGKFSPEEAITVVPHICEALQYAHDIGVVHRDIKPENILIDKRGRVIIADFGLAKILNPALTQFTLTGAREVLGTPHYMAPEQLGRTTAIDHRADIYALGVVFYEMLTGELPVGRFAPPSRKVEIDVRLDEVVLRTLENEPGLRYQSARDVKTDIQNIADHPDTNVGAAPSQGNRPADLSAPASRNVILAAFILVAGILDIVILLFMAAQPRSPERGIVTLLAMLMACCGSLLIYGTIPVLSYSHRRLTRFTCILAILPLHPGILISFIPGLLSLIRLSAAATSERENNDELQKRQILKGSLFVTAASLLSAFVLFSAIQHISNARRKPVQSLDLRFRQATERKRVISSAGKRELFKSKITRPVVAPTLTAVSSHVASSRFLDELGSVLRNPGPGIVLQSPRGLAVYHNGTMTHLDDLDNLNFIRPRLSTARDILYTIVRNSSTSARSLLEITSSGSLQMRTELPASAEFYDISPDGAYLVFQDSDHVSRLLIRHMPTGAELEFTALEENGRYPAFSPDGRWIAYCSNSRLMRKNVDSLKSEIVVDDGLTKELPAWSPDGKWIAYQATAGDPPSYEIYKVEIDEGAPIRLTDDLGADANPCFSADGNRIAFASERDSAKAVAEGPERNRMVLYTMNSDGSNQQKHTASPLGIRTPRW